MSKIVRLLFGVALGAAAVFVFFADFDERKVEEPIVADEDEGLPESLALSFPDEIPALTFPCATLTVPDSVKTWSTTNPDAVSEANASAESFRDSVELPLEIIRGREDTSAVALTVDTGTAGALGVDEMLRIADHYDIPLTFFVTGCWALENPDLMQRIIVEGHDLGQHSLTHANLTGASDEILSREIDETTRIIEETTGVNPVLFRKPQYAGGDTVTAAVGERGMISVQGWPDLGDTTGWHPDVDEDGVRTRIENRTAPGAIWVLHNLSLADLNAFEDVIRFHLESGYDLVRVYDIVE